MGFRVKEPNRIDRDVQGLIEWAYMLGEDPCKDTGMNRDGTYNTQPLEAKDGFDVGNVGFPGPTTDPVHKVKTSHDPNAGKGS